MVAIDEINSDIETGKLYESYRVVGLAEAYDRKPGVIVKCINCGRSKRIRYSNLKGGYYKPCVCVTGEEEKLKIDYISYLGTEYQGWKIVQIEKSDNSYKKGYYTLVCKTCSNTIKLHTYNLVKRIMNGKNISECDVCKNNKKHIEALRIKREKEHDDSALRKEYIGHKYKNDTIIDIKGNANYSGSIAVLECSICNRKREVELGRFLSHNDRRIVRCECEASGYNTYSPYIGKEVFGDKILDFVYTKEGKGYNKKFIVQCTKCNEIREIENVSDVARNSKLKIRPVDFGYKLCNCNPGTRSEDILSRYTKYIGKKIEGTRLTILDLYVKQETGKKPKVMAKTRCDCINKTISEQWLNSILSGHTRSCGCNLMQAMAKNSNYFKIDFIGKIYDDLEVLDVKQTETGGTLWECKCLICGKAEWINPKLVVERKWHISCGCKIQSAFERNNKYTHEDLIGQDFGGGKILAIYRTEGGVTKWKMVCPFCGEEYIGNASSVAMGQKKSCGCIAKSLGEKLVRQALIELNINFKEQVSPKGLKSIKGWALFFDFVIQLPENKIGIIEYDGEQHYELESMTFGGEAYADEQEERFYTLQENDKIKNGYCAKFNYPLLRLRDLYYHGNYEAIKNKIIQFFEIGNINN